MTGAFSSMNIDHTHLVKYLDNKDTINFSNLEHISSNKSGYEIFNLTALNKIRVTYAPHVKKVSIEANLPYFGKVITSLLVLIILKMQFKVFQKPYLLTLQVMMCKVLSLVQPY